MSHRRSSLASPEERGEGCTGPMFAALPSPLDADGCGLTAAAVDFVTQTARNRGTHHHARHLLWLGSLYVLRQT